MRDKHQSTEERNEGKLSRSVLKTNGVGDNLVEFNATTNTGKSWNGSQLQTARDRYSIVRANVTRKRTRSSRRLLRRLSGAQSFRGKLPPEISHRERRFQGWVNHNISKTLVHEAKKIGAALAFEMRDFGGNNSSQNSLDLTGIRDNLNESPRGKTERRRTNNWAFYQLRLFVGYKAAIAGIPVVFVAPAYTSKTCSRCHHVHPETDKKKSYRNGKNFKCKHCHFESDADINAAKNIAALGISVNNPEIPGITCSMDGSTVSPMCG